MGLVYFSVPVIAGYYVMQYVSEIAEENMKNIKSSPTQYSSETKMQNQVLNDMLNRVKR
jgi:hypothetical protein